MMPKSFLVKIDSVKYCLMVYFGQATETLMPIFSDTSGIEIVDT